MELTCMTLGVAAQLKVCAAFVEELNKSVPAEER